MCGRKQLACKLCEDHTLAWYIDEDDEDKEVKKNQGKVMIYEE